MLCCFELVLKAIIFVLAGDKKRRSLALDAVVSRAFCSYLASFGPYEIMAMSSA